MFGSSNTNTNTGTTSAGLFGGNTNTNSSTGGLFGNKPATTTSGGPFGNTSSSNTGFGSQQNTNQPSGGGLFGSSNTNTDQPSGGGLFGSSNTNTNSGGLFGNKPSTTTTGGGLFGNSNQNQNQNPTTTSFGSNQQQSSGGLFGGNQNSSSLGGGLFGNKSTTTTNGGLFGSNQQQQQPQQSSALFGSQQQSQQPQQSSGLFGSQQQQQPQQSSLFGSSTINNQQPSFSWSQPQQQLQQTIQPIQQQQNQQVSTYTPAINDQLTKIWEQWDPKSNKNLLKTHLYNKFSESEIQQLLNQPRPQDETSEDWDNAMSNRPGPLYYPIKVSSFSDVASRVEIQLDHVSKSRILLDSINEKLNTLSSKHDLENTTRILKAKAKHTKLSRRLLRLATILAILKLKGYPLLPEEEEISKQFELINMKLNDPNGNFGKLSDIFARLSILKERAEEMKYQFDYNINVLNNDIDIDQKTQKNEKGNTDNKQDIINKLSKVLLKQQMGLNYLNDILEKDLEKLK
ncbi:unnamed protein product [Candida verbasci]|uniref:Nucleoporin Nup54 alpha-helical domain-containing protein n=1 Tax=Candida verbasci TaxID=1227364 RepID=A0A9W4XAY9_9ASCO|nr:unnamed protein product [Candida verbasci]